MANTWLFNTSDEAVEVPISYVDASNKVVKTSVFIQPRARARIQSGAKADSEFLQLNARKIVAREVTGDK